MNETYRHACVHIGPIGTLEETSRVLGEALGGLTFVEDISGDWEEYPAFAAQADGLMYALLGIPEPEYDLRELPLNVFELQVRPLRSSLPRGPNADISQDIIAQIERHGQLLCLTEFLFSYGTLQQEDVQRATFGRLLDGAADALVGFRQDMLEITDASVIAKSGKRFHPIVTRSGDDADRVAGTVYLITSEELAAADAYEVADYERVEALLASGERAWVYVKRG